MSSPLFHIVEPHGDDAFISCFQLMRAMNLKHRIRIFVETFSERSSTDLEKFGMISSSHYHGFKDLNYSLRPKIDTHKYNRLYRASKEVLVPLRRECVENVSDEEYERVVRETVESLATYDHLGRDAYFLAPIGLDHPYHIVVARTIYKVTSGVPDNFKYSPIFYAEKPYLSKRYIRQALEDFSVSLGAEYCIVTVGTKSDTVHKSKEKIFREVYPTEVGLLRFTRDSVISDPDVYFVPIDLRSMFVSIFDNLEDVEVTVSDYYRAGGID